MKRTLLLPLVHLLLLGTAGPALAGGDWFTEQSVSTTRFTRPTCVTTSSSEGEWTGFRRSACTCRPETVTVWVTFTETVPVTRTCTETVRDCHGRIQFDSCGRPLVRQVTRTEWVTQSRQAPRQETRWVRCDRHG